MNEHVKVIETVILPEYGTDPHKFTMERAALSAAIAALQGDEDSVANLAVVDRIGFVVNKMRRSFVPVATDVDAWSDELEAVMRDIYTPPKGCGDPECGCDEPSFTTTVDALEFLSGRFKYAGVSAAVARYYARDIDRILAAPQPEAQRANKQELLRQAVELVKQLPTDKIEYNEALSAVVRAIPNAPNQQQASEGECREAGLVVRDVCELDPADPDATDTVTVRVDDLQRIVERRLRAPVEVTDECVVSAARELSNRNADACGVDRKDNWKTYGDDYLDYVRAALTAVLQPRESQA